MFQKTFQSLSLFKHNCVSATSSRGKAVYKCRKAKITGSLNSSSCSMPNTKHVIFTYIIHHFVRSMNPLNLRKKGQSYTLYNGQIQRLKATPRLACTLQLASPAHVIRLKQSVELISDYLKAFTFPLETHEYDPGIAVFFLDRDFSDVAGSYMQLDEK